MSTTVQAFPKQISIRTKMRNQRVSVIYYQGQMVPFLIRGGKIMYAEEPLQLPQTAFRYITDDVGTWFEIGFLSAHEMEGDAVDGWVDIENYLRIAPENSLNMVHWHEGNFSNAPGGSVVNNGDGTYWYWARCTWAKNVKSILADWDLRSRRGGKSITSLTFLNAAITLPNFPYAVETDMPQLQTDLRAAGYTDAIASYDPLPYTAEVKRHYQDLDTDQPYIVETYQVTHDGETVTDVYFINDGDAELISLPGYPYALPSQAATLQADLITAGHSGAVVRLFAGEWRIYLPDRTTSAAQSSRYLYAVFIPNDPFPRWASDGAYQGLINDQTESVGYNNLRNTEGAPLIDASSKQFFRYNLHGGSRFGPCGLLLGLLLHQLKLDNATP